MNAPRAASAPPIKKGAPKKPTLAKSASDIINSDSKGDLSKHSVLKSSLRIGSRHGRLNYGPEERAFHPTDVPARAVSSKMEVRNSKKPDILGVYRTNWNQSVNTGEKPCFHRSHQIAAVRRFSFFFILWLIFFFFFSSLILPIFVTTTVLRSCQRKTLCIFRKPVIYNLINYTLLPIYPRNEKLGRCDYLSERRKCLYTIN